MACCCRCWRSLLQPAPQLTNGCCAPFSGCRSCVSLLTCRCLLGRCCCGQLLSCCCRCSTTPSGRGCALTFQSISVFAPAAIFVLSIDLERRGELSSDGHAFVLVIIFIFFVYIFVVLVISRYQCTPSSSSGLIFTILIHFVVNSFVQTSSTSQPPPPSPQYGHSIIAR